ncbi:hypothetical protein TorRG33x02_029030 [Trema orientale]|uniref:Uncharacterized protein n=1 Tax=Trema orientale TaxID=63057 RepID=A0A2P5FTQ1_TREOI|nr:hypothetical protein TorRG33x02_029030 [Trema orientale]
MGCYRKDDLRDLCVALGKEKYDGSFGQSQVHFPFHPASLDSKWSSTNWKSMDFLLVVNRGSSKYLDCLSACFMPSRLEIRCLLAGLRFLLKKMDDLFRLIECPDQSHKF